MVTGYEHNFLFTHFNISSSMSSTSIYYDIDANDEQSGCPVYISGDNSKFVGIHKGYNPKRNLNVATMIT